jgi:hypothetical protein
MDMDDLPENRNLRVQERKKIKTDMQDYRIQYHRLLETIRSPVILVEKKKKEVKSWVTTYRNQRSSTVKIAGVSTVDWTKNEGENIKKLWFQQSGLAFI